MSSIMMSQKIFDTILKFSRLILLSYCHLSFHVINLNNGNIKKSNENSEQCSLLACLMKKEEFRYTSRCLKMKYIVSLDILLFLYNDITLLFLQNTNHVHILVFCFSKYKLPLTFHIEPKVDTINMKYSEAGPGQLLTAYDDSCCVVDGGGGGGHQRH